MMEIECVLSRVLTAAEVRLLRADLFSRMTVAERHLRTVHVYYCLLSRIDAYHIRTTVVYCLE